LLNPPELDPLRLADLGPAALHQPTQQASFADARRQLGRQEEGFAERLRAQLDPDLVLPLPQRQEAILALSTLDDHIERRLRWRSGWHGRCGG